jgi:hypothetical protein
VPSEPRDVEVSGGKGVVVGDYAVVFQSFANSPPSIGTFVRDAQFRSLVDERTKNFVGRDFVFDSVERAVSGQDFPSGYVVIRGEPGIGKTAIAASLVIRKGYVHHFNIAPENIRSPAQFLENVCAQLIIRYDLDHAVLPPRVGEDPGFLSELLGESAARAGERGELPVVVVVDALDEADDAGLGPDANRLFLPRVLPAGVFFVVTTREETDYRLDVDHATEIWIQDSDPKNIDDVARYVRAFVDSHSKEMNHRIHSWGVGQPEFIERIVEVSEGNFMYLVHVLPEIAAGTLAPGNVGEIDGLPRGLVGYYKRHWRDMKDADSRRFSGLQRPVLCFLAISREPVSVMQLCQWTSLEPGEVQDVVKEWREFLNEDAANRPPLYRVYHRSFAEFLDDQENLRWYHDQIVTSALGKIPGFLDGS